MKATTRIQIWRFVVLTIGVLTGSVQNARGQIIFPDGVDHLTVDRAGGPNGNGRIYIGDHGFGGDPCHYRINLPPGKSVNLAGIYDGEVYFFNGDGKLKWIPLEDFEKVDKNGNPCPATTSALRSPAAVAVQTPISIAVSNDADSFDFTCDRRFAVVVGANSATPVSLVDLQTHTEVDKFAYNGLGRSVTACADGQSVLVVLDNDAGTASVIKRLTITAAGKFADPHETLALGSATMTISKVFSVPGSKTGLALTTEFGTTTTVSRLVSFSIPGLQMLDSVVLAGLIGNAAAVSCAGDKVYVRSGKRGPSPDVIEGFSYDPVTGAIGDTASPTITNVSFATGTVFENPLAVTRDGTHLIASEPAAIPTPEVPTPQVTFFDAATGARLGKFEGPEFVNPGHVATVACCAEVSPSQGPDLTITNAFTNGSCVNTRKTRDCPIDGTLTFLNNAVPYIAGTVSLVDSSKLPPKVGCTFSGTMTLTVADLGTLPKHLISFYLSDDATFDAGDARLLQLDTGKVAKAFQKNKPVKLSFKLPKGVCPTDKFLIVVVDDVIPKTGTDAVSEVDENNNAVAYGPLP